MTNKKCSMFNLGYGRVWDMSTKLTDFEARSLSGQRVVVTQARGQSTELTRLLQERGAEVVEIPAMRFTPPTDPEP